MKMGEELGNILDEAGPQAMRRWMPRRSLIRIPTDRRHHSLNRPKTDSAPAGNSPSEPPLTHSPPWKQHPAFALNSPSRKQAALPSARSPPKSHAYHPHSTDSLQPPTRGTSPERIAALRRVRTQCSHLLSVNLSRRSAKQATRPNRVFMARWTLPQPCRLLLEVFCRMKPLPDSFRPESFKSGSVNHPRPSLLNPAGASAVAPRARTPQFHAR